jgi:Cupredoxin-like domain
MSGSRRRITIGAFAGLLFVAAAGVALAVINTGPRATLTASPVGYGTSSGMMGGGYGMMGGGYGPAGTPESGSSSRSGGATPHGSQAITLTVKSDSEHGKRGPDGSWHDAFLPAGFTVHAGESVTVTVYNYDDAPHSFTSQALDVNQTIPGGSTNAPSTTTFTLGGEARHIHPTMVWSSSAFSAVLGTSTACVPIRAPADASVARDRARARASPPSLLVAGRGIEGPLPWRGRFAANRERCTTGRPDPVSG